MKREQIGLCIALGLLASSADAQTITGTVLRIYRSGASTVAVAPVSIPLASYACAQAATAAPSGTVDNPTAVRVQDPNAASLDCQWTDGGTGVLATLAMDPAATYEATLAFTNATGEGPESARSNLFRRPGVVPAAPARLRVVRP